MTREGVWWRAFFLALERTGGKVSVAAQLAGVNPSTVYRALVSKDRPTFRVEFEVVMDRVSEARKRHVSYRCDVAA